MHVPSREYVVERVDTTNSASRYWNTYIASTLLYSTHSSRVLLVIVEYVRQVW